MKLLYGTTNKSKIEFMQKQVAGLGIEIVAAPKLFVEENGSTPLENARLKALAHHAALGATVFAADSGLYIEGLEDARQPGLNVRGENDWMTDDDAIAHYSALAREMGGRCIAQYKNAICLITADGAIHEHMGDDTASEAFYLVDKPHALRKEGFPLDALSVEIATGKYYYDLGDKTKYEYDFHKGFADFFKRALKL